jgi:hypothetical protein
LQLAARADPAHPPHTYRGRLTDIEHLMCASDGTIAPSSEPIDFTLEFPADYCRSVNPTLQFRVAHLSTPLFHPNVRGGIVCLGPHFKPSTRARAVVEQIYRIVSARVRAIDHGFDADACRYYLAHSEQVAGLRAAPLWRRRLSSTPIVPRASSVPAPAGW